MCAVSAIIDQGRRSWPEPHERWPDFIPFPTPKPSLPSKEEIEAFRDLLERAKEFDRKTKQPDCEDPKKVEWLKDFCTRLRSKSEELAAMADELEKTLET